MKAAKDKRAHATGLRHQGSDAGAAMLVNPYTSPSSDATGRGDVVMLMMEVTATVTTQAHHALHIVIAMILALFEKAIQLIGTQCLSTPT